MNKLPNLKIVEKLIRVVNQDKRNLSKVTIKAISIAEDRLRILLDEIRESFSEANNERQLKLLEFLNLIIFTDLAKEVLDLMSDMISLKYYQEPVVYEFKTGKFKGKEYSEVLISALQQLNAADVYINYTEEVWKILLKSYILSVNDERFNTLESATLNIFENISSYKEYPQKKASKWIYFPTYPVQKFILEQLNYDFLNSYPDLSLKILGKLLELEQEGQYFSNKQFTLHWSPIAVNETTKEIRTKSIDLVFIILEKNADDKDIIETVFGTIDNIRRFPMRGVYSKDLEDLVLKDVKDVLNRYTTLAQSFENVEILKKMEEDVLGYTRRFKHKLKDEYEEFRTVLSKNQFYFRLYSLLSRADYEFEDISDWKKRENMVSEKTDKLVKEITKENLTYWIDNIFNVGEYLPVDKYDATLFKFLEKIGKDSPFSREITEKLIRKGFPYYHLLIKGMRMTNKYDAATACIELVFKSEDMKMLLKLVDLYHSLPFDQLTNDDQRNMGEIRNMFIKKGVDMWVCLRIFNTYLHLANIIEKDDLNQNLLKILNFVESNDVLRFINGITMSDYQKEFLLEDIQQPLKDKLINLLINTDRIDYSGEEFLFAMFKNCPPEDFVNFFYERSELEKSKKKKDLDIIEHYDAIPYRFTYNREGNIIDWDNYNVLLEKIISIFILGKTYPKNWKTYWNCSQLMIAIDPNLSTETCSILDKLIRKGEKYAYAISKILSQYHGIFPNKYPLLALIIQLYGGDKDIAEHCEEDLFSTGVVEGEDGILNSYKAKLVIYKNLKKESKDVNIIGYCNKIIKSLNLAIKHERKKVLEREALSALELDEEPDS